MQPSLSEVKLYVWLPTYCLLFFSIWIARQFYIDTNKSLFRTSIAIWRIYSITRHINQLFITYIVHHILLVQLLREKGRVLTRSYDKSTYTHRKIKKATWHHKDVTKNFDYITIADRLRTFSWSNNSYPTGVVKPVYEHSTLPLTATAMLSKGYT